VDDLIPLKDLPAYMAAHPPKGFKPVPFYSAGGDFLILYFEDAPCYTEGLSERAEVMRAFDDNRVVGVKLYRVPELIAAARERQRER
jgi:hypothetical protein